MIPEPIAWAPQPTAEALIADLERWVLAAEPGIARFAERLHQVTGTRLGDWLDHLAGPEALVTEAALRAAGFVPEPLPEAPGRWAHPAARFPAVIQDIAVVVDGGVPAAKVQEIMESSALVARVQLFDVFEGEQIGHGRRSLAFAVHFQSPERTLTDEDVADARRRIIRRLEREAGAELRGG